MLIRGIRGLAAALAALFVLTASFNGLAATVDDWTNSAGGLWQIGSNWSSNLPPDSTFALITITNSGAKQVVINSTTPAENLLVQRLTIGGWDATNALQVADLATNLPLQLLNTLAVDRGGELHVTNAALGIDGSSGGILNVIGGTVVVDNGLIDCSLTTAAKVGNAAGATGTIDLNSGAMQFFQIQLGAAASSLGVLNISNGILNSSSLITLGQSLSSTGMITLTGGELIATNDLTRVGNIGHGQMHTRGGTAKFAFLSLADNYGSSGLVQLEGGELHIMPRNDGDLLRVGNRGAAQLNISGGTHVIGSEFHLADDPEATGVVSISGGELYATNARTSIGRVGVGQLTIEGGLVVLTNSSIGRHEGSVGTVAILTNGTLLQVDDMSIGRFANSVGHVLVAGGLLGMTNETIWVGREGSGDLTVSNGMVIARLANVGVSPDGTNAPVGLMALHGGETLLSSNLTVGTFGISTGQVQVAGGSLVVGRGSRVGHLDVRNGSFTVSDGLVRADTILATNAAGQFTFAGGVVQADSIVVSNGTPFVVGDGFHSAKLELMGGSYVFADGLVISSNATVTGCGTILGNIINNGVVDTNCPPTAPVITDTVRIGTTAAISFTSISNAVYTLEYNDSMTEPNWTEVLPSVTGTGGVMSQVDTNAIVPSRFYRIRAH